MFKLSSVYFNDYLLLILFKLYFCRKILGSRMSSNQFTFDSCFLPKDVFWWLVLLVSGKFIHLLYQHWHHHLLLVCAGSCFSSLRNIEAVHLKVFRQVYIRVVFQFLLASLNLCYGTYKGKLSSVVYIIYLFICLFLSSISSSWWKLVKIMSNLIYHHGVCRVFKYEAYFLSKYHFGIKKRRAKISQ